MQKKGYKMTTPQKQTILKGLAKAKGWKVKGLAKYKATRNRTKRGERQYIVRGSWRNLLNVYEDATNEQRIKGEVFYEDARDFAKELGNDLGYSNSYKGLILGAGIISVLSPRTNWEVNKQAAKEFVSNRFTNRQTGANNEKALLIAKGNDPMDVMGRESHKTKAFYKAICDPLGSNEVWGLTGYGDRHTHLAVVDRHAGGAYLGKQLQEFQREQITHWRVNKRISNAYFKASKHVNIPVNIFQSIVWNVFRDANYNKKPYNIQRKRKKA